MDQLTQASRFLRRDQVLVMVGIGTTKLYSLMNNGSFPKPVHIGRATRWVEDEVLAWMAYCVKTKEAPESLDALLAEGGAKWYPSAGFMGREVQR